MTIDIYSILLVVLMVLLNFIKITDGDFFLVFLLHGESAKNLSLRKNLQM